jgi:putative oxidoreductase
MRLALGIVMLDHGYQNLFRHLRDHVHLVTSLGVPAWLGYISSFVEFFGAILILAGLFTRPAALAICIDLAIAIWKVHWRNGLMSPGGIEFPLALATLAFALIFFGAGPIALDHVLRGGGSAPRRS